MLFGVVFRGATEEKSQYRIIVEPLNMDWIVTFDVKACFLHILQHFNRVSSFSSYRVYGHSAENVEKA